VARNPVTNHHAGLLLRGSGQVKCAKAAGLLRRRIVTVA
jgi:hypothetical protein